MKMKKEKRIGEFVALSGEGLVRFIEHQRRVHCQWEKRYASDLKKMRKLLKTK